MRQWENMSARMSWSSRQITLEKTWDTLTVSTAGKDVQIIAIRMILARSGPGVILILPTLFDAF